MIAQLTRFSVIGTLAAATHFLIVKACVPLGYHPLVANILAFIVAFQVSYWGHNLWTFAGHGNGNRDTCAKFLLTAILGFILNESLYAILLNQKIHYDVALIIVLISVAAITFIISRLWAFNPKSSS